MSKRLRVLRSGALAQTLGQLMALRRADHSPWRRVPRTGYLRGIDHYPLRQLPWVMAHAMAAYRAVHGMYPDIVRPTTFNEKIFWTKFFGEIPVPLAGNKLATADFIPAELRQELSGLPVVWRSSRPELPGNHEIAPGIYYFKANKGSGLFRRIRYPLDAGEREALQALARNWLASRYGLDDGEWWYHRFTPEVFLERSVSGDHDSISWNFYVLNGQVPMVGMFLKCSDGEENSTWLDATFERLPHQSSLPPVTDYVLPEQRHQMMDWAKRIAQPLSAVRVDFLQGADGRPYLCELTFAPGNALTRRHMDIEQLLSQPWELLK